MIQYKFRHDPYHKQLYTAFDIVNGIKYSLTKKNFKKITLDPNVKTEENNLLNSDTIDSLIVPVANSPISAEVHLTALCNLKCNHCFQNASPKSLKYPVINKESWKAIFNQLEDAGIYKITLSGGEPLFHKEINSILKFLTKKKFRVEVLTNGTLINDENSKFLKSKNIITSISLDGATSQTHDKIRGEGNYDRTINGISILSKKKASFNIAVTLYKDNVTEIDTLIMLAKTYKAFSITFTVIDELGRAKKNPIGLSYEDKIKLTQLFKTRESDKGMFVLFLDRATKVNKPKKINYSTPIYCTAGTERIAIRSDGNAFPCIHAFDLANYNLGNIANDGLNKIWNSSKLNEFRGGITLGHLTECKSCNFNTICDLKMKCRLKVLAETSNYYGCPNDCLKTRKNDENHS